MRIPRVPPLILAATLSTAVALSAANVVAAQGSAPAVSAATTSFTYRFVLTPVLTYSRHTYGLVFRLNRDLPRTSNRRAKAVLRIGDAQALAVRGGGEKQRCFMASVEGIPGGPRFGKLYAVELSIPGFNTVRKRVRLKRATPGYGAFYGNEARDPKARALHCGPR
jgi:hypothetical protein